MLYVVALVDPSGYHFLIEPPSFLTDHEDDFESPSDSPCLIE